MLGYNHTLPFNLKIRKLRRSSNESKFLSAFPLSKFKSESCSENNIKSDGVTL